MKASELIKRLTELVKEHGDLDLIYSTDDEGNNFDEVKYSASKCIFKNGQLIESDEPTHICIN